MGELAKGLQSIFGGDDARPAPAPAAPGGMDMLDMLLNKGGAAPTDVNGLSPGMADIARYLGGEEEGQEMQGAPAPAVDHTPWYLQGPTNDVLGGGEEEPRYSDIDVEGFAPTKRNLLGKIADALVVGYGGAPIYEGRMKERDTTRALKGYLDDPQESLRRLMQVNPDAAVKLANQLRDDTRADRVAGRLEDANSLKYMGRLGGMINAIKNSSNPEEQYTRMYPKLKEFADRYKLPTHGLPETWDEEAINAYVMSNVDVDDQIKQAQLQVYREGRLSQMDRGLDIRERGVENTQDYREERLEDFDDDREERRNRPRGRGSRGGNSDGPMYIEDKNTGERVGMVNEDRTTAYVEQGDTVYLFRVKRDGSLGSLIRKVPREEFYKKD